MEKQKMTIHRALSELKLIDSKIKKQTDSLVPCGIYQKDKLVSGHLKQEDLQKLVPASYQSILDLIKRKTDIKSAIVQANGVTKLNVAGKEMTIADAINYKSVLIFKKDLINSLKRKSALCISDMNNNNDVVNQNVQKLLEFTFGKENVKADSKDLDAVRKPYVEANEFHLFDPLNFQEKIDSLEKEVEEFEMEVDASLSEINSTTFIEI